MGRILVKITRYNEWLIDFVLVFLYIYKVAIIKEIFFQILSINPEKEIEQSDTSNWKKTQVSKLSSGQVWAFVGWYAKFI